MAGKNGNGLTIDALTTRYIEHCNIYYRKPNGTPTHTAANIRSGLNVLCDLRLPAGELTFRVGTQLAAKMTPVMLRGMQRQMAESGRWARSTLNLRIRWFQQMMRWAALEQLVPDDLPHRLSIVGALKRGRSPALETQRILPVAHEDVMAVVERAPVMFATMIQVHWFCGARPGELVQMAWSAIDQTCDPWLYRPPRHKLEHHDRERIVPLGPACQRLLLAWRDHHAGDALWPMHVVSYARVVRKIQENYGLTKWRPNQIRHAAATRLRREMGIEAARVVLGHSTAAMTEVYAEADCEAAMAAMQRCG